MVDSLSDAECLARSLIEPKAFEPIFHRHFDAVHLVDEVIWFRAVVRFLAYEYLPRTQANLALADIRAQHPNATVRG